MQHIVEGLQPVLLAAGRDTGPGAAGPHDDGELGEHVPIAIQNARRGHHMHVGADRAARHRKVHHASVGRERNGVEVIVAQALGQDGFDFLHALHIEIEFVAGALQGVPHGAYVRLRGPRCQGAHRKIDAVHAACDPGHVAGHRQGTRVVRVLHQGNFRGQDLLQAERRFVASARIRRAGCIFHADRVHPHIRRQHLANHLDVLRGGVQAIRRVGQAHHGNAHLVVHASLDDGAAGSHQVLNIVHEVEVAVDGGAVLLHELGLQLQGGEPLRGQGDAGYGARQDLQVDFRSHSGTHLVHTRERILVHIEVRCLVARAASELEMAKARGRRGLHGGQDVLHAHFSAENALQAVPEGGEHDADGFTGCRMDHDGSSQRISSSRVRRAPEQAFATAAATAAVRAGSPLVGAEAATRSGNRAISRRIARARAESSASTATKAFKQILSRSMAGPLFPTLRQHVCRRKRSDDKVLFCPSHPKKSSRTRPLPSFSMLRSWPRRASGHRRGATITHIRFTSKKLLTIKHGKGGPQPCGPPFRAWVDSRRPEPYAAPDESQCLSPDCG